MSHRENNISAGTQVVSLVEVRGTNDSLVHPRGAVGVKAYRERLLAVKHGEVSWYDVNDWRNGLRSDFERALAETKLPERPGYDRVNGFLVRARQAMANLDSL